MTATIARRFCAGIGASTARMPAFEVSDKIGSFSSKYIPVYRSALNAGVD
jgi:hypothetical protein